MRASDEEVGKSVSVREEEREGEREEEEKIDTGQK